MALYNSKSNRSSIPSYNLQGSREIYFDGIDLNAFHTQKKFATPKTWECIYANNTLVINCVHAFRNNPKATLFYLDQTVSHAL